MPKNEAALDFDLLPSFLRVVGLRVGVVVASLSLWLLAVEGRIEEESGRDIWVIN